MDIWVGEWSLATDVCALWLGGFNDNNTPYSDACEWVDCPYTYLPEPFNQDFDRSDPGPIGPLGDNDLSTIRGGQCPIDSQRYSDEEVNSLATCALYILNTNVQGHFLWTFKNELEPKWSYKWAYDKGWMNQNLSVEEIAQ